MNIPPIHEIVYFLNQQAPDALDTLKKRYPKYEKHLELGVIGGENDGAVEIKFLVDIVGSCLPELLMASDQIERALSSMAVERQKRAWYHDLGQIIAIITSSSLVAVLFVDVWFLQLLTALLTCSAQVLVYMSADRKNLAAKYEEWRIVSRNVRDIRANVKFWIHGTNKNEGEARDLVNQTNKICEEAINALREVSAFGLDKVAVFDAKSAADKAV